ncbi:DNA-binding protein, partial [Klebsiella pneumoniae]|nr:DNA-binding protein [Klebsiella pneumoniae]
MARVSISEAARLKGKSRTTLHRLIKTGDLSTCSGERN